MFDFIKNFCFAILLEHWTDPGFDLQILLNRNWKQNVHLNTDIFPLSFVIHCWYSYCPIYFQNSTMDPAVFHYIFFCPFYFVLCSAPHILFRSWWRTRLLWATATRSTTSTETQPHPRSQSSPTVLASWWSFPLVAPWWGEILVNKLASLKATEVWNYKGSHH